MTTEVRCGHSLLPVFFGHMPWKFAAPVDNVQIVTFSSIFEITTKSMLEMHSRATASAPG
jgi:hypothetical protein